MADVEGKKLTELRVIDLKTELERRGLDKTGNKAALLERLSKVNCSAPYIVFFSFFYWNTWRYSLALHRHFNPLHIVDSLFQ